jgi:hypothetical protein
MKKNVSFILFFISLINYSQSVLKQSDIKTTEVEYKFLTEKYAFENDSIILEGYELHPLGVFDSYNFRCEYKSLVELKNKKEKAILITILKKKGNIDKVKNLCLPINNEALFKKFIDNTDKIPLTMNMVFNTTAVLMVSSHIQKEYNFNFQRIKTTEEEYELKPFVEETIEDNYNFNYKLLVESKSQNVKAIFIKITKLKKNDNRIKYLCMPLNNKELSLEFEKEANKTGVNMAYFFNASVFSILSKIVDDRYNSR